MASKRAIYSSWHIPALAGDNSADGVIAETKELISFYFLLTNHTLWKSPKINVKDK